MNQLTKRPGGAIMHQSSLLSNVPGDWDDLSSGVLASFPILGIKSGKWHYRWKGEDTVISDDRGFAVPALNVVIVKAQKELTRTFYPGGYVEGVNNPPTCWSSNGVAPDDTVVNPVNANCATCPNAEFGSGASPAAPKAQACQQRRRVVVVPYNTDDLTNEEAGGPCLLSVPPGSLRNLDAFSTVLKEARVHYFGCIVQLSFDQSPNIAFPKIEFTWVQGLDDAETKTILELRDHEQVARILNSKINVDGPEVEDSDPVSLPPTATGARSASPTQGGIPPKAASPKAPLARAVQQTKVAAAIQPAPVQVTKPKIGGFVASVGKTPAPISAAVAQPTAPPATARVVKAAPQPAVEEPTGAEVVDEDNENGPVPDALNNAFSDLMSQP